MSAESGYLDLNLAGTGISDNVITNQLQLFFQEVQIAISVGPQGTWGARDSISISKYIFNQYVTVNNIQNEISSFISAYCSMANYFPWTLTAEILNVDGNDLIYIQLSVTPGGYDKSFIQKYLLGAGNN